MKLPIEVTLTSGDSFRVDAGPRAIADAEKHYGFTVSTAASKGLAVEPLAYMAWAQAARDAKYLAPWKDFWDQLDDIEVVVDGGTPPQGQDPAA